MKNSRTHKSVLILTAGLTLMILAGNCWAVTQNFIVTIPNRSPRQPVARVKITLDVPGASAGNTLQVNGSPAHNLDPSLAAAGSGIFATVNGPINTFLFYSPSPNTVAIEIVPLENLNGADYFNLKHPLCPAAPPCTTLPIDINIAFDGPLSTGFRLSSYGALSSVAKGIPSRRLDVNAARFPVGQVPQGTDGGRHGLDVILVLDKSGSMGDAVPPLLMGTGGAISTGQVKMDVLHSAVHQFVNAWKLDLPLGSADDRLGVVVFESAGAATTRALTLGGSFFVPRATWDSIPTAVDLITPGGDTALGDGINEAIRQWNLDPKNDLNLVVMTNGIQNDGNQIVPDVMIPSLWDLAGPVPGSTPEPLINRKIPIQTIGVGAPDSVQSGLLDGIAMQTGGTAQLKTVTTLDTGFLATLVSILKGNTLSIVSQEENTLGAGVSASAPTAVDLNVSIKRAIVVLGWFGAANAGALGLQIFPPSGTTPIIPAAKEDGAFSTVQAIDLPANGPAGEWTLKVIRSGPSTAPVFYHLTVLAADGRFTYRMDFAKAQPATGDPLILRMELGENGTPLTSLGGAIQVRIERPQTALGTALRNLQVASTVLTTDPAGFTPDSFPNPYERKLFNFLSNPLLGDLIRPTLDPNTFTMFDDGRPEHGDDKAGDGVYSMRYDKTSTPGIYKFRVTLDSNTVSLGKLHRYEERETLVAVRVADPKQSETAVSKEPAPGSYRLDIVPADRFGNFLGPGYADFIKVTLTGGGTVNPTVTDERENGTYTLHITGVPTGANPTVSVKVIGIEIAGGTLTTLSKPNKKFAFFGGVGLNFPHGVFNTFYNSGLSTQLGFEYRFTNRVSAEGTFGYDRFKFAFGGGHQSLVRASGNLKVYPVIGTYQLGFFGGGGIYHFTSGTTRGGVNIGVVNEFRITTSLSLEGTYNFHNVFTAGASTRFSTLQGGFRFRF